jgi:C_GCAxxG_C_C family probable redox protein
MKSDEAGKTFMSGFNCAQSVFKPFAAEGGIGEEAGLRIASSFGAGMARLQETCGAVTGGFMAIGLRHGFSRADDQNSRDVVLRQSKELVARFKEKFGTIRCSDLLGCDLNTDEGQKFHKESGQREQVCLECVKFAASVVEGMKD